MQLYYFMSQLELGECYLMTLNKLSYDKFGALVCSVTICLKIDIWTIVISQYKYDIVITQVWGT